jgi:hypothetical protein
MLFPVRKAVCGAMLLVGLAGCEGTGLPPGAKPTVPVKVTVTYKGAPVEGATVTFIESGETPTPSYGLTDAQGSAQLKTSYAEGAVVGAHQVTITKTQTEGGPMADQDSPDYNPDPPPAVVKSLIPQKYGSTATSGLSADVKKGDPNEFTFDLTD